MIKITVKNQFNMDVYQTDSITDLEEMSRLMIELMDYHTDHNNMIINDRLTGKLVSITPQLNSVIEFEEVLDV